MFLEYLIVPISYTLSGIFIVAYGFFLGFPHKKNFAYLALIIAIILSALVLISNLLKFKGYFG